MQLLENMFFHWLMFAIKSTVEGLYCE